MHAVQEHGEEEDEREDSEEESYQQIKIKEDKEAVSSDEEYSSIYKQINGSYELQKGWFLYFFVFIWSLLFKIKSIRF